MMDSNRVKCDAVVNAARNNWATMEISVVGHPSQRDLVRRKLGTFTLRVNVSPGGKRKQSPSLAAELPNERASSTADAKRIFDALESVDHDNAERAETPAAMRRPLYAHQQIWLAWARKREKSTLGSAGQFACKRLVRLRRCNNVF